MKLVIVRHGKAEEKKPGMSDEERRLADEGRKDVECVARLIPWRVEVVYTSPLRRAVETAEIIASIHRAEVRVVDVLRPQPLPLEEIAKLEIRDATALVGHAPYLEDLLKDLTGGLVKLATGAAAGVEAQSIEKGKAVLVFLITPDICKKLG
jgi:phosphohistidine phosphatase